MFGWLILGHLSGILLSILSSRSFPQKVPKVLVRRRLERFLFPAPLEADRKRMERVIRQYQTPPLSVGQTVLCQRQIQVFIPAVELVTDQRMAHCGQVDADLVFPARFREHPQERELRSVAAEAPFDLEFRHGARPIAANAIFDGDLAGFILAQRQIDGPGIALHRPVDDGQIDFLDRAVFPYFAQLAGGNRVFGSKNDATCFTVDAIDQVGRPLRAQIKPHPADEARPLAILGGMTDQTGGFIDNQ